MSSTEVALPLAVAALRRRTYNAKSPKERHDTAYFAWEASVRLAVAARPPADAAKLAKLALPSTGHFVDALSSTLPADKIEDPDLLAVHALFSEVAQGKKDGARAIAPARLFSNLAAYRNQVIGHGSTRTGDFYDDASEHLANGLVVAWRSGLFLPAKAKIVFVESIEIGNKGERRARLVDLMGEAPRVLDPKGTVVPESVLPSRLWLLDGESFAALHPWLLYREADLREQLLFFNGRTRSSQYLDYVSGEPLKGKALAEAFPTIEDEVTTLFDAPATSSAIAPPSEQRDDQLGDYTILGKLGEGGMGIVYLARQESLGRLVALKMLSAQLADDPVSVARFRREIKSLSRAEHPNIVKILASGTRGDTPYYAMELVEGSDLSQIGAALGTGRSLPDAITTASDQLRKTKAELFAGAPMVTRSRPASNDDETSAQKNTRIASFFRDAALAIQALHDAGIIHRDLKPANLMVTAADHRLVVMDLGLAATTQQTKSITRDKSSLLGTLRYMPPEQLQRNLLEIDARADVYSLGATFYELLTGKAFLEGETEAQLVTQVLHGSPKPPREVNTALAVDLAKVVEKATEKDRALRYGSAQALADDLGAFLAGRPVAARRPTFFYRASLAVRRRKAFAATAAAGVAILGVLGAFAARRAMAPHDCAFGDAADCTTQCERGSAGSCFTLGDMFARAIGVPKDDARARSYLGKACAAGHGGACHALGAMLEEKGDGPLAMEEARVRYDDACNRGNAQGCNGLAIMLANGRGGAKDVPRAVALYQRACDAGYPNACSNLGIHYDRGEGVAEDAAKARALYEKACAGGAPGGSSSACGVLAISLASGRGGPVDESRASKLFEDSCNAGHMFACFGLGGLVEAGRGVAPDADRATKLYRRACEGNEPRACVNLGLLIREKQPQSLEAFDLYRKACDGNVARGCELAGEDLEGAHGVAPDLERAAKLHRDACERFDYVPACIRWAVALRDGKGVVKDEPHSAQILTRWCSAGENAACEAGRSGKVELPKAAPLAPQTNKPHCRCTPGDPLCTCL